MRKKRIIADNLKIIIITCIVSTICSLSLGYATDILFAGNEVSYDNSTSGLNATTVQGALDEMCRVADLNDRVTVLESNQKTLDDIYPVGSVFISTSLNSTTAVHNSLGGTWEAYGEGRTLIGVGTGTDTNSISHSFTVNNTGGQYEHTLTVNEMPSHNHAYGKIRSYGVNQNHESASYYISFNSSATTWPSTYYDPTDSGNTGGSQPHTNIQPYIVVYMYKRIS